MKASRQGPGEASAVARNDGSVGLFYLDPGSLGTGTQQTWVFRNFTPAEGTAGAVAFLNEPARRGPGRQARSLATMARSGFFILSQEQDDLESGRCGREAGARAPGTQASDVTRALLWGRRVSPDLFLFGKRKGPGRPGGLLSGAPTDLDVWNKKLRKTGVGSFFQEKNELTLCEEARERRIVGSLKPFRWNPAGSQSRPVELDQQPEASLAWGVGDHPGEA